MKRGKATVVPIRVIVPIVGLWLLLSPGRPIANAEYHRGQVYAQAGGGLLVLLAAFPYRAPRDGRDRRDAPEDLWRRPWHRLRPRAGRGRGARRPEPGSVRFSGP